VKAQSTVIPTAAKSLLFLEHYSLIMSAADTASPTTLATVFINPMALATSNASLAYVSHRPTHTNTLVPVADADADADAVVYLGIFYRVVMVLQH
jgi:hypothetical protein